MAFVEHLACYCIVPMSCVKHPYARWDPISLRCLSRRCVNGNGLIRREVVSVWHAAATCNTGISVMIKCRGLMKCLSMVLRDAQQCNETAVEALGLLKRLTYIAEESRLQILDQPGMLNSLAQLPFAISHT